VHEVRRAERPPGVLARAVQGDLVDHELAGLGVLPVAADGAERHRSAAPDRAAEVLLRRRVGDCRREAHGQAVIAAIASMRFIPVLPLETTYDSPGGGTHAPPASDPILTRAEIHRQGSAVVRSPPIAVSFATDQSMLAPLPGRPDRPIRASGRPRAA